VTAAARPGADDEPTPADRFFAATATAFERAAKRSGERLERFEVAGHRIDVRVAGPGLAERIAPAMRHLTTTSPAPRSLEIQVWDSASTGERLPAAPCGPEGFGPRGHIAGCNDDRYSAFWEFGHNILRLHDAEARRAVFWIDDAERLPYWISAVPLRQHLHWWSGPLPGPLQARRERLAQGLKAE